MSARRNRTVPAMVWEPGRWVHQCWAPTGRVVEAGCRSAGQGDGEPAEGVLDPGEPLAGVVGVLTEVDVEVVPVPPTPSGPTP